MGSLRAFSDAQSHRVVGQVSSALPLLCRARQRCRIKINDTLLIVNLSGAQRKLINLL